MNLHKSIFLSFSILLCVCMSCKKDGKEIDKSKIQVILLPTTEQGNIDGQNNYTFNGLIFSQSNIEIVDYGFRVVNKGTSFPTQKYLPLAVDDNPGKISIDFSSNYQLKDLVISAYVVLEDGDTLRSIGDYGVITVPLQIVSVQHQYDTSGYETFSCDIINNDTSRYTIRRVVVDIGEDYNYKKFGYENSWGYPMDENNSEVFHFFNSFEHQSFWVGWLFHYRLCVSAFDRYNNKVFYLYTEDMMFTGQYVPV